MINLIKGEICFDETNILSVLNCTNVDALSAKGLLERKEYPGGIYYYAELVENGTLFGIFVSFKRERIDYIALRWLEGPCTSKDWSEVSEKALSEEYQSLLNFARETIKRPPDYKRNRSQTWHFAWGEVDVSYEPRDFVTQIYMKPR